MALIQNPSGKQTAANDTLWFAMRVTYRRELRVQKDLEEHGVCSFVPMQTRHERQKGKIVTITEPAIHNLIFIHTTQEWLQEYKTKHTELQYIITRDSGTNRKTTVPEKQMQDFISICRNETANARILSAEEFTPSTGELVRIVDGPLAGMTGTFQKVKGGRQRQFVITIANLLSVTTATVSATQVERVTACES